MLCIIIKIFFYCYFNLREINLYFKLQRPESIRKIPIQETVFQKTISKGCFYYEF